LSHTFDMKTYRSARRVDLAANTNYLFCCDGLDLLDTLDDGSLDLIYIDPPFRTGARRTGRQRIGYDDAWHDGLTGYLALIRPCLEQMHRVLKRTGTLFVHLDYRSVHYVKVELDRIFGSRNFMNEIIWQYRTGGLSRRWFGRKHQTILAYAKCLGHHTFHLLRDGQFRTDGLNIDENGRPYKTTKSGRLYFDRRGPVVTDVWDMPFLSTVGSERVGWPDQKPLALLERIIRCCSNPGDRVGDFFVGSGTTVVAAGRLGRRWLGCDINMAAIDLAEKRLENQSHPV